MMMNWKRPDRTTMEGMIWNANHVLDMALNPKTPGVPRTLLEGCRGVALISVVEAGFIFSGNVGTGVVLSQNDRGDWSPPSAIGMGGVGFGLLAGAEVKDILIVLVDDKAMNAMSGEGQIKLGGQIAVTAGPIGREVEGAFNLSNKGAGITLTYSFSKGIFAGIGLEGAALAARQKENERFYGKKASPRQILFENAVEIPEGKGIVDLHRKLDLMKEGKVVTPDEGEKAKKEELRVQAEQVGEQAKEEQGDEVKYVEATEEAEKEKKDEEQKPTEGVKEDEKPKEEEDIVYNA